MRTALLLLVGCGSSAVHPMASPDMARSTLRLVATDYSLDAGQEKFLCRRQTVTSDMYITEITPVNGLATHHEVLGIDKTPDPDGLTECAGGAEFDVINWKLLFAAGVNSPSLTMPDGVAIKVAAGQQLVFQMHLLNATQSPVSSNAAIDVRLAAAAVANEAQMILAGPIPDYRVTDDIPVGTSLVSSTCTMRADTHYFAVFPHMHQIGKHILVAATTGGGIQTLYDEDYAFSDQDFKQFAPIALKMGDQISVACSYDNQTGAPVQFGQSSYQEMCFAISFIYPPLPTGTFGDFCTN